MQVNGNFLFIECVNSMDGQMEKVRSKAETDISEHKVHGFGLKAVGMVAEKHGSILIIQKEPFEFSVRTNLYMKKTEP